MFGVVLAFAGLAFLAVSQGGGLWFDPADNGWLGGSLWWVAVTAGAGILVGLLRRSVGDMAAVVVASILRGASWLRYQDLWRRKQNLMTFIRFH